MVGRIHSNNKKQLDTQTKILVAQFRQSELERFRVQLNKPFAELVNENLEPLITSFTHANFFIQQIIDQYQNIFPVLCQEKSKEITEELFKKIHLFSTEINSYKTFSELSKEQKALFTQELKSILKSKNELLNKLQDSVLKELEQK